MYAVVNRYLYYIYTHFIGSALARVTLDNEVLSTLLGKVTEITSPEVITGTYVVCHHSNTFVNCCAGIIIYGVAVAVKYPL